MVTARSNVTALAIKCGVIGPASGTGGTIAVEGADRVLNEQARLTKAENQSQQAYLVAKQQLDRLMDEHHLLGEQIKTGYEHLICPPQNVVVNDYAEPSRYPVGPDRPLGALLLGVGLFPILAGWLLVKPQ